MEFCPPAEKNLIYAPEGGLWYAGAGAPMDDQENPANLSLNRPVADNIITLLISPREERAVASINNNSAFDSRAVGQAPAGRPQGTQHLLPPMLKVVLVAIDERSAERLSNYDADSEPPLTQELGDFNDAVGAGVTDEALETALENLKIALVDRRINFRVFSTTVQIRGSKWSL
jgi:uncharacterized protein (TIGR02599 family)